MTEDEWNTLPEDPFDLLVNWLPHNDDPARPLMILATLDADGAPDVRSLLLSEWDREGFFWHTDSRSRKVAQVEARAQVALCIPLLGVPTPAAAHQLVVAGRAERATPGEEERAYRARPPYLQQLAWQNNQEFAALPQAERIAQWSAFHQDSAAEMDPPATWIGYRVRPTRLTFWFGSPLTASRRMEYRSVGAGWERLILAG